MQCVFSGCAQHVRSTSHTFHLMIKHVPWNLDPGHMMASRSVCVPLCALFAPSPMAWSMKLGSWAYEFFHISAPALCSLLLVPLLSWHIYIYCRVPARRGLQQTARAAARYCGMPGLPCLSRTGPKSMKHGSLAYGFFHISGPALCSLTLVPLLSWHVPYRVVGQCSRCSLAPCSLPAYSSLPTCIPDPVCVKTCCAKQGLGSLLYGSLFSANLLHPDILNIVVVRCHQMYLSTES